MVEQGNPKYLEEHGIYIHRNHLIVLIHVKESRYFLLEMVVCMEGIHQHLEGNPIFPEEKFNCTQGKQTFLEVKVDFIQGNINNIEDEDSLKVVRDYLN